MTTELSPGVRRGRTGLVIACLLLIFSFAIKLSTRPNGPSGPRVVTYRVGGSTFRADINYANETHGMDHEQVGHFVDGERVHWSKTVRLPEGEIAYVTAQNNETFGSIWVEIDDNRGNVLKRSESRGEYAIATASD